MKKTTKILLLAIFVLCTISVLTVMAGATEEPTVVDSGFVMQYTTYEAEGSENNVLNNGAENDVKWTLTSDGVLTISSTNSSELKANPGTGYKSASAHLKLIPWYTEHKDAITSIVVEETITSISSSANCIFGYLPNCTSITFDASFVNFNSCSMTMTNLPKLANVRFSWADYTGFEDKNVFDLRYFGGSVSQCFESGAKDLEVVVLMPLGTAPAINHRKIFTSTTKATIYILDDNSPAYELAHQFDTTGCSDNNDTTTLYLTADNTTVAYYNLEGLVIEGKQASDGVNTVKWVLDVETGLLTISRHADKPSGWVQLETNEANWISFANTWKNYVKDVVFADLLGKVSLGRNSTAGFLKNSTSLETVTFKAGQRIQNNTELSGCGLFEGCTALNAVTFGGTIVTGVADFSGASVTAGQDSETLWLDRIFSGCDDITKIILPTAEDLTIVKATAFDGCTSLTEVVVGANIQTIEADTFKKWTDSTDGYSNLTVRFTEESSTVAADNGLASAGKLTVVVPQPSVDVTSGDVSGADDSNDLVWNFDVATGKLTISGESTEIVWADGKDAGWNGAGSDYTMVPWYANYKDAIKVVEITAPITAIPVYMFGATPNVEEVILPDTCVTLGTNAFVGCRSLKSLKTAGITTVDGIIDLRNITGTCNNQVFENAFGGEVEIWLPKEGNLNLNNKFGANDNSTVAHFVVYPGSVGETTVYNMINSPNTDKDGNVVVYGTFTYDYYTAAEDAELAKWTDLLSGVANVENTYGTANWTLDIETGIVTVTVTVGSNGSSKGDCTLSTKYADSNWIPFRDTFKYAVKAFHIDTTAKLAANFSDFPELTKVLFNGYRLQGGVTFKGLTKLTTIGTMTGYTEGVIDLRGWQDIENNHNHSAISSGMFEGCTSIKKVILPVMGSKYGVISIASNAFKGCTSLEQIVVPEGCGLLSTQATCNENNCSKIPNGITGTIDATAFDGVENVTIVNEVSDSLAIANAIKALIPGASVVSEYADGLTRGVVFDGWKVRTSSSATATNGLRGVFYFDNDVTALNEGWELVEYGALLATTANKNAFGTKVVYADGETTTEANTTRHWPIYYNGAVRGKTLNGNDVDSKTNGTYFAVSVVNYSANWTTDVYMAGYEIWTKDGQVVIMYTDYGTDEEHNDDFIDTNIYEVSMDMYMYGAINAGNDKENIVWNTLVEGGKVVLHKDTDYVTTDDYTDGEATDLSGDSFGPTFELTEVPMVNQSVETTDTTKLLKFADAGVTYTILNNPFEAGKYVIVYRDNPAVEGTAIPGASAWGQGYYMQMETNWYPGNTSKGINKVETARPNPKFINEFYKNCTYAIIDYGVTEAKGECFKNLFVTTMVYNETFKNLNNTVFQGGGSLTTVFPAGTKKKDVVAGLADFSKLDVIGSSRPFNAKLLFTQLHLPEGFKGTDVEFANGCYNLTTLWVGDNSNKVEGVINLSNTSITSIGKSAFAVDTRYNTSSITKVYLPASCTSIDSAAFTGVAEGAEFVHYGADVEAIRTYCTNNGYTYTPIASMAGWSTIVVD